MLFKLLYVIFVICQLLWGHFYLGGVITPRQLMVIVMFVACVTVKEIKMDKYWWIYVVFIVFYGISSAITGYIFLFLRQLIGFYFASFVAYRATIVMIKKYRCEATVINTLVLIGVADAVVTIGQYLNIPVFNDIVYVMRFVNLNEQFISIQERSDIVNRIAVPGIVGAVTNGYVLSFLSVMALFNKKGKLTLWNLAVWSVLISGSFCAQERSGFIAAVLLSLFMIVRLVSNMGRRIKPLLLPLLIAVFVVGLVYLTGLMAESESRHSLGINIMEERAGIYRRAWAFFVENPMGGFLEFIDTKNMYPHNIFLNALLQGGIFGGIAILVLLIMQFSKIIPYFIKPIKDYDDVVKITFAFAFTAYSINSLVHNLSIVSGDANIWILWGGFLAVLERQKKQFRITNGLII